MNLIIDILGKIKWAKIRAYFNHGKEYALTKEDHAKIESILELNSCFILTRRNTHLSTYACNFADWYKTGKWGYWSHCLINLERDGEPYKLAEATGRGSHWSTFEEVFNCDAVCLLKPKGVTLEDWKKIFENIEGLLGIPYDSFFNFCNSQKISCIELVYLLLQAGMPNSPSYLALQKLLGKYRVLTPQMLYSCGAFEVILEIRR